MRSQKSRQPRAGGRRLGVAALALGLASFGACDSLLEVEIPGDLTESETLVPANARMLVLSSIAEFECGVVDFAVTTGGMEDSYIAGTGWGPFRGSYDRTIINVDTNLCGRIIASPSTTNGYMNMQRSRVLGVTVYDKIKEWGPQQVSGAEGLLATAATYVGFNLAFFGDSFCSMAVDQGPLMTPTQTRRMAEEWFTNALGHAQAAGAPVTSLVTPSFNVATAARVGRARVRLALGDLDGAAADAALVPPGFIAYATRGTENEQRRNSLVKTMTEDRSVTIHPEMRNLTISADGRTTQGDGVPDPRVPVTGPSGTTQNSNIPLWIQRKYTAHNSPVPVAKWSEAQYILAEVAVKKGQTATAVNHINAVRDSYNLPRYQGGTAAEIQQQIIQERRREFFFEGRFHGDMIRYGIPFPMGTRTSPVTGLVYGNASCFLMPVAEYNNNPNLR
jgi:hypothetical protein